LLADSLVDVLREESSEHVAIAERIEQRVRRTLQKVRSIARGLAVTDIDSDDLPDALAELADRLGETSGVRCRFLADRVVPVGDSIHATHLYHIAQEACSNALKHSGARNLELSLRAVEPAVILEIRDDGNGMDGAREGLGLRIMRNRARVIGARLTIAPAQPRGTLVICTLDQEKSDDRYQGQRSGRQGPDHR
jgi:signal transduction histidine kinase